MFVGCRRRFVPRSPAASLAATLLTSSFLLSPALAQLNPVLQWNAEMLDAIRADSTGPTLSTRNLAILNASLHDAVNSITLLYQPYRVALPAQDPASPEAAAIAAGHEVLLALYPGRSADIENRFNALRLALGAPDGTEAGLELGTTVARLLLAERSSDGANTTVPYIPSVVPGQWRRTPPFFRPPLDPHWRYVTPFCLPGTELFVAPGPPPLDSPAYAAAVQEVQSIGAADNSTRTPEQSQIAVFWSDFSYTAMPPGHWHEIAIDIATQRHLPLPESAHLMALLSLTQADCAIVCWEAKYRHNFWRPVTAIQRADEDNNPDTPMDPSWNHYLASPNFPEYPSGHSTFSKASAQVLTHTFGTDAVSFTARSDSLPGVTRSFSSFAACADEVGMSRIYGGIHFSFSNRDGKESGRRVADYVLRHYLFPATNLPCLMVESPAQGSRRFLLQGWPGTPYTLECTTNFTDWTLVTTLVAAPGGTPLPEPLADDPQPFRFYRARSLGGP